MLRFQDFQRYSDQPCKCPMTGKYIQLKIRTSSWNHVKLQYWLFLLDAFIKKIDALQLNCLAKQDKEINEQEQSLQFVSYNLHWVAHFFLENTYFSMPIFFLLSVSHSSCAQTLSDFSLYSSTCLNLISPHFFFIYCNLCGQQSSFHSARLCCQPLTNSLLSGSVGQQLEMVWHHLPPPSLHLAALEQDKTWEE